MRTKKYLGLTPIVYLCMVVLSEPVAGQALSATGAGVSSAPDFTRVTLVDPATDRANSQGAAWVDYDGDGDLDLSVANIDGTGNFLYQNDGQGHLDRVTSGTLATDQIQVHGLCWADADNDDDLDVFMAGPNSTMYVNDGAGNFAAADPAGTFGTTDLRGWACAWADYDVDGFVDLVITHPAGFVGQPPTSNHLFHNRGDGTFEQVSASPVTTGQAPYTVATWSDFDLDGDPDLFIGSGPANGTPGPDFIYRNMLAETGSADFVRVTDGPLATRVRDGQVINWIDYDNDGDFDVYVTNWGGANGVGGIRDELYRNDGGTLVEITTGNIVTDKQVSLASDWGDFDNDGDLDVYVSDGNGARTSRFYDNNGDGAFTKLITGPIISDQAASWGAAAGDFDGDGDLDLFVANAAPGSQNFLYRNDLANGNHWLKIRTVGTASNRAGIGAIVRARAVINGVPTWMMRDVSSQNSFNGHNDLTVHFGVGDAVSVDSLIVIWPSGAWDLYEDVDLDQTMTVTEGESPTTIAVGGDVLPEGTISLFNYPNPFSGSTRVVFTLGESETVNLSIYDPLGRLVATPVSGERAAGRHEVSFQSLGLPGGPYLYRLSAGDKIYDRVMVVLR